MSLVDFLKAQITQHGPMRIDQYMSIVLGHPEHGYYMKQDPFGVDGDFTTAPEISQMFGEVIGAYMTELWLQMGKPDPFVFLECGPGRGTMMADMMRAAKVADGFDEACQVHLLENSPVLKARQAELLEKYTPTWHETLGAVPGEYPVLVVANEFLDALPVRQMQRTEEGWQERVVCCQGDEFQFGLSPLDPRAFGVPEASEGAIYEFSPARDAFVRDLCDLIKKQGGAALLVDYGHTQSACGDTLQALYKHGYVSVFDHIGDADLTAHVDFESIEKIARQEGIYVTGPVGQGAFLHSSGIEARAQALNIDERQGEEIEKALHRLTHSDEMGSLFKVIGLSYGPAKN